MVKKLRQYYLNLVIVFNTYSSKKYILKCIKNISGFSNKFTFALIKFQHNYLSLYNFNNFARRVYL